MSNWNCKNASMNVVVYGATGPLGKACIQHFTTCQLRTLAIARTPKKLNTLQASTGTEICAANIANAKERAKCRHCIAQFLDPNAYAVFLFAIGSHIDTPIGCNEKLVQEQIRTNLELPLQEALYWAHHLTRGHFIFFADAGIQTPQQGYHAYRAAKSGIMTITKTLARDLAPAFRVNAVAPGIMNLKPKALPDAQQRWSAQVPLGHIGSPQDIVQAVAFLVEHQYLTGVILPVDGGFSLGPPPH